MGQPCEDGCGHCRSLVRCTREESEHCFDSGSTVVKGTISVLVTERLLRKAQNLLTHSCTKCESIPASTWPTPFIIGTNSACSTERLESMEQV